MQELLFTMKCIWY